MSSGAGTGAGVTFLGAGAGVKKKGSDHLSCRPVSLVTEKAQH